MTLLDAIGGRRLVLVTGKGGAGKSVLAATIARLLVGASRRVLLLESDPRESLYRAFGIEPSGGESVRVQRLLELKNLDPRRVIDDLVRDALPIPFLIARVLRSPVYRHFVDGAPGLKEAAALAYAVRRLRARRGPDVVVFDAPATGHALAMIDAPSRIGEAIAGGPVGRMAGEVASFLADPAELAVVVASLAEPVVVEETIELLAALRDRGREPVAVVLNAVFPGTKVDPSLRESFTGPVFSLPIVPHDDPRELVPALVATLAVGGA